MANNNDTYLTKRGEYFQFRIRWKGKLIRRSLKTSNRAIARDLRDEYLNNLFKYNQMDAPVEINENITFGEMAKIWASIHKKQVKYSTWPDYKSSMNERILPVFKDRPINDITHIEVLEFRNSLDVCAKRANNIMIPMKSVFDLAQTNGIIKRNVLRMLKRLPIDEVKIDPFSYQEIQMILKAVDQWYRPYVEVLFFTGMRAGEANGLTWKDYKEDMEPFPQLDINKTFVQGQDGPPKTKSSFRMIDCLPEVVSALNAQTKLTGHRKHIFLARDGSRMTPDHFRNVVWIPALEKAGLEYRPPIQIRHSFATMMISSGEVIGWVQNMLGHASLQMINQRYYKWKPRKTRNDGQAFRKSIRRFEEKESVPVAVNADLERDNDKQYHKLVTLADFRHKKSRRNVG